MKDLFSFINEASNNDTSISSLISKYLGKYEVKGGEHIGHGNTARRSYLVKCNSINDVADICKGIWSIIAEWQGQDKPEEECIKYMATMWKGIFNGDMRVGGNPKATYVMIPFEIYDKN